jgi:hypothetical protein
MGTGSYDRRAGFLLIDVQADYLSTS